jgi:ATP-dependent Clp protease ATP-binding subunit ClpC
MFERFTDRARRVIVLAQEEARKLNHNYIGTEHILLGLIHEGEGVAPQALSELGISLQSVRLQVEEIIGQGTAAPSGHIPFTPRAKKVLELSLREALQLGHNYIGTEHILLGLVREGEGVAAQVLQKLGAGLDRVREEVIRLLATHSGEAEPEVDAADRPESPLEWSAHSTHVLRLSRNVARSLGRQTVEPEHILLGLLAARDQVVGRVLKELQVDPGGIGAWIEDHLAPRMEAADRSETGPGEQEAEAPEKPTRPARDEPGPSEPPAPGPSQPRDPNTGSS